jgi:M6 family metalloprotease-like protein
MCIICQTATIGASLLTSVLPISVLPPETAVPTKSGTACRTIGATTVAKSVTLTCKRVGKRLVWTRTSQVTPRTTTTTVSPTTTTLPVTTGGFSPDAQCADQETPRTTYWQVSNGFPKFAQRIPSAGSVRVLMLPVDFPDVVATGSPATDMLPITRALTSVFGNLSNGALSFEFSTLPNYLRVGRAAESWGMGTWGGGRGDTYVADIVRELDPQVNFSGVDVLVVMAPPSLRSNQIAYSPAMPYPQSAPLMTGEKAIFSATMTGADAWRDPMTIVHEFGHLIGLTDLYAMYLSDEVRTTHHYTGKWDFMGYAWTKGMFGWQRFLQGWLEDAEVLCANNAGEFTATLAPLGSTAKSSELLLLRGASGKLVGLEVRRPGAMDEFVSVADQGVLVYTIDPSGTTGGGPLRVQGLSLDRNTYLATAPLRVGQSLTVDGWTITVTASGDAGDAVRVSR